MENRELRIALRVLAAITEREEPNDADLKELRRYAPSVGLTSDELACEVVQRALKARAQARGIAPKIACATCDRLTTAAILASERYCDRMGDLEVALILSDDTLAADLHQKAGDLRSERDVAIVALREHQRSHAKTASAF
jgi:hypothetical protein